MDTKAPKSRVQSYFNTLAGSNSQINTRNIAPKLWTVTSRMTTILLSRSVSTWCRGDMTPIPIGIIHRSVRNYVDSTCLTRAHFDKLRHWLTEGIILWMIECWRWSYLDSRGGNETMVECCLLSFNGPHFLNVWNWVSISIWCLLKLNLQIDILCPSSLDSIRVSSPQLFSLLTLSSAMQAPAEEIARLLGACMNLYLKPV